MFFRERAISLAAKPNSANSEEQPHALHDETIFKMGAMKVSGRHHLYNRGCRTKWHPRTGRASRKEKATGSRYLAHIRGIVLQTRIKGIGFISEHIFATLDVPGS